jgi:Trk K+ transport system NAD-binding subunit
VGIDGAELWIEDCRSTNGIAVRRDGIERVLPPSGRTVLKKNDTVTLGDFKLFVRHE